MIPKPILFTSITTATPTADDNNRICINAIRCHENLVFVSYSTKSDKLYLSPFLYWYENAAILLLKMRYSKLRGVGYNHGFTFFTAKNYCGFFLMCQTKKRDIKFDTNTFQFPMRPGGKMFLIMMI